MKHRIAERLGEAGLSTERFIDCRDGEKKSVDHTRHHVDEVSGEYGIYALASDGLVILDIDDYEEIEDRSGLKALHELEPTLEQGSPHGGTHRFYAAQPTDDGRLISKVFEDTFGKTNPNPSWGEVRTANQYVVGAGSQLDGCDREDCEKCAKPDGGNYDLQNDTQIATHTASELVDVLKRDPDLTVEGEDDSDDESGVEDAHDTPSVDADDGDILEFARACDDKLDRLWRGDYSDYGGDRSEAECSLAMKLGFWFQGDKRTVRNLMDRANTKKWSEREDDSYRDSVLEAVDEVDEHYDPSEHTVSDPADFDPEEVERGVAILNAETTPESPAGEMEYRNGCYGYETVYRDDEGNVTDVVFDTVCNFTIETLSYLTVDDGQQQLKLRIHPQHPMGESYDVRVEPAVFNTTQTFKEEIVCGRTTTFTPSNRKQVPVQSILGDLRRTVGSQMAPQREGTEFIGLSDDGTEWVTPEGSITGDGWADDPDHEYYVKTGNTDESGAIAQKWQHEHGAEYDADAVRSIVELLPQIRHADRGLPILGWFYAAPLKPHIVDWSGEFNLLEVTGETGSGKTTTLQSYWQLFGADTNPFSASDTGFTIEKHMAESCGLPVWIDEYKPADIPDHRLDRLHRRLREVTRERTISKGTQSLDEITFTIRAPVVISGEQKFKEAAVRRRAIMTNLTQAATDDGTDTIAAFGQLTGTSYENGEGEEQYPNGHNLGQHALAYYQWMVDQDQATLQQWWEEANDETKEILSELRVTVENTEQQGLQTVVYGVNLFREFAADIGADASAMPTRSELKDAINHVVSNIGKDGNRREHTDEWLELLTLATNAGYLNAGQHFKITDSRKYGSEVLDVHMPSAFPTVMKYLREFNLEGEYTTLSKGDYVDAFANKADQDESYVLETSVKVNTIENGSKCVRFDPGKVESKIADDFTLSAFTETEASEEDEDPAAATPISELDPTGNPYTTVTVTVNSWETGPENGPAMTGTFEDASGIIDVVDFLGCEASDQLSQGKTVRVENARVSTYEGTIQLEIAQNTTQVTEIQEGAGHTSSPGPGDGDGAGADDASQASLDGAAAADGGKETVAEGNVPEDAVGQAANVRRVVNALKEVEPATENQIVAKLGQLHDTPPDEASRMVEQAIDKGVVFEPQSDQYQTT